MRPLPHGALLLSALPAAQLRCSYLALVCPSRFSCQGLLGANDWRGCLPLPPALSPSSSAPLSPAQCRYVEESEKEPEPKKLKTAEEEEEGQSGPMSDYITFRELNIHAAFCVVLVRLVGWATVLLWLAGVQGRGGGACCRLQPARPPGRWAWLPLS